MAKITISDDEDNKEDVFIVDWDPTRMGESVRLHQLTFNGYRLLDSELTRAALVVDIMDALIAVRDKESS